MFFIYSDLSTYQQFKNVSYILSYIFRYHSIFFLLNVWGAAAPSSTSSAAHASGKLLKELASNEGSCILVVSLGYRK